MKFKEGIEGFDTYTPEGIVITHIDKTDTNRGKQFVEFADEVVAHVDKYTIPQYGDAPHDMVEVWTAEHVQNQIEKYLKRMKNNGRGKEDNLLSCLKIAHYTCILKNKLEKENN